MRPGWIAICEAADTHWVAGIMYKLSVDPEKRLIRFELFGQADAEEIVRFQQDVRKRVLRLRASGPHFSVLADMRQTAVLPRSDTATVSEELRWWVENGLLKSAGLVASTLLKLQTERLAPHPAFRYFTSEQEALAWLAS